MTDLYLAIGIFVFIFFMTGVALRSLDASARSEEELDSLRENLDSMERFNERMSLAKKKGGDLVRSLRDRAKRGLRDKG